MDDDYDAVGAYNYYSQEEQEVAAAIDEASGYEREALEAQKESASAARANALKIAQLQASTSRYGIDAQSATAMRALKENARQFDAAHGLDIAKAYTAFSSTPDMMFARNDFMSAMGRVGQGLNPAPIASQGQPHAKTWQDFASIAQYNGSQVPGGGGGGGGGSAQSTGGGGTSTTDPRVTAANAVMRAIPPSETSGNDGQDWAALEAVRNLYSAAKPGSVERLGAPREKIAMAGLARMGYDPAAVALEYKRTLPGQMSPLLGA